ncbi:MAG: hypothetical protein DRJ51_06365 [Thermoprotei archaeon]|nr:MAG: hypothetical protein DRJ36_04225 [Thermoprotei archaeon]RLE80155.1 MAG: hypothetical protein DRJ51_06365 [Thermoprotei archaeon]RLF00031.1 MAG: hypothetical protein DRJ59_07530 [Thermoprotei archaeon]
MSSTDLRYEVVKKIAKLAEDMALQLEEIVEGEGIEDPEEIEARIDDIIDENWRRLTRIVTEALGSGAHNVKKTVERAVLIIKEFLLGDIDESILKKKLGDMLEGESSTKD